MPTLDEFLDEPEVSSVDAFLDEPESPRVPIVEPPSTLRTSSPEMAPRTFMSGAVRSDPEFELFARKQVEPHTFAELQQGVPTKVGVTPSIVPSGRRLTETLTGIPQEAADVLRQEVPALKALDVPLTVASSVARTGVGLTDYMSSPQGVTELVLSMTPAKLLVLGKWAYDMGKGAYTEGAELRKLLAKDNKTPEDYQAISDHTINAIAMALGAGFTSRKALGEVKTVAEKLAMPEGKIKLEDRGDAAQEIFNRFVTERQIQAGSPFVRAEPPTQPVTMGVRTQPPLSMEFDPQGRVIGETFDPSGLRLTVPPEVEAGAAQAIQPPAPAMAPGPRPVTATREIRLAGEAAQRMADWQKAVAEKISQEQKEPVHPNKPLTANQLRIMRESLERDILQGQIPGKRGLVSGSDLELWADQVLNDVSGPQEFRSGIPLKYAGAVLVKAAAILERGITDAAQWTAEMVKEFGEDIRPYLTAIRSEADQFAKKGGEQDAIQRQTAEVLRDVRQPEVAQEGQVQVPVGEGSPQTAQALAAPELPPLRPGDTAIKIQKSDGTVIDGVANGKTWQFGVNTVPNVGRAAQIGPGEVLWSDGPLRPGEKIIESPTPAAPSDIISTLESLKLKRGGEVFSFPHPGAVKDIGVSTWNTGIDVAIGAIKAGKTVSEATDSALEEIRKKTGGKFDEAKIRANLQFSMGQQRPQAPLPSTEGETLRMRQSAERATTSPMVPEPVQERIANAPESFYKQQSMNRVEEVVDAMSDAELDSISRDSNLYTAGRLKKAQKAFERGDNEAGYRVFEELEKEGTTMGQLINQFKLLKGTRPENVVRVINQKLKTEGKDVLTDKQSAKTIETAKASKEKDAGLAKATAEWQKNPTPENAAAAEKALIESNAAALELQRLVSKFTPRSTAAILKTVLQGGLLTPISEVANIVGNMSLLPFRATERTVASSLDVLDNFLTGRSREITTQPIRGTAEALKGLGRGAKNIPDILLRGPGDVVKGETRAGLHPLRAWANQFAKNPELPTTGGKLTLKDRLNLAIEGTLGVPAEAMLRGLSAGDVAFREAAKSRATATELRLANVPKDKWSFAQKFPELFLDDTALQRIQTDTLRSIFQRPSRTLNLITNWIRGYGEWFDLAMATVAPYKMTPWNIVAEILSYNPLVAAAKTVNNARLGNTRAAKLDAGKFVVGTTLTAAGWWLYQKGLMSPSLDQRDEAQKARILAGEVMPPNHINISGLKRALEGGDPSFKAGDETVDVFRAGGLAGSMFYMTANIGRDFERNPSPESSEVIWSLLRQSTLEQARFGMNQSFLQGVEGLLSAVRDGNTDNYVRQWANTVSSIPLPTSLTVLSRATREYKPDFREDAFAKQAENIVRNRLGFAGLDDYLPLKRGLWGEPLRETPPDRNALVYHFFDVTKNRQVTSDPVPLELFRLWRKTGDTRVIPSLAEKEMTVGRKTYLLDTAQHSRYAELVGQSRRRIVDAIVVNPNFHKLPDESKITILDRVYRAGMDQGKAKFWQEVGGAGNLREKPSRAGFEPGTPQ